MTYDTSTAIYCHCGIKFGEHPTGWTLSGRKDNCFLCGTELEATDERYRRDGNSCIKCSVKCEKNSKRHK